MREKKGQGALEYLLLIGSAILISAVAIMALTAVGIGAPSHAQNLYNERYNALYHKSAEGGGTPGGSDCGNGTPETGENCTNCSADIPCTGQLCCNDICTPIVCLNNSDCDDSNPNTTDTCNNPGTCQASCSHIQTDTTPPTTAYDGFIDGEWVPDAEVTVILTCDDGGESGCNKVLYRIGGTGVYTEVSGDTATFTVSTEGTNLLEYRSIDVAGNPEETKSANINIDKTFPIVSITSPNGGSVKGTVTITANASDAVSGINKVAFWTTPNTTNGEDFIEPYTFAWNTSSLDGAYNLFARAIDNASNDTIASSVQVLVDNAAPSQITTLTSLINRYNYITVKFNAPKDALGGNDTNKAFKYDLRYCKSTDCATINSSNWNSITNFTGEPTPAAYNTVENITISGLTQSTTYRFAIKSYDELLNESLISNVLSATTNLCGNGTCDAGETNVKCPEDCPA